MLSQPWKHSNSLACALARAPPGHSPRVSCPGIAQVQKCVVITCLPSKGLSLQPGETWCWKHCAGCGRRKCRAAGRYSHSSRNPAVQHTSLLRPPPANRSLPPPFKLSDNFQCSQEKMLEPSQNKSSHSMSSYKISSKGQPSS